MSRRPLEEAVARLNEALKAVRRHRPEDGLPEHVRLLGVAARAARHARRVEEADILARSLAYYQHQLETGAPHPPPVTPAETSTPSTGASPPLVRPRAVRHRSDTWTQLLDRAVTTYEQKTGRTPTGEELWMMLLKVGARTYDVVADPKTQTLRMPSAIPSKQTLRKAAFLRRFQRLFAD